MAFDVYLTVMLSLQVSLKKCYNCHKLLTMEIPILRNENKILREYPYTSPHVRGIVGVSNEIRDSVGSRGGMARNTVSGKKLVHLTGRSVRCNEQKAVVPIESLLRKKDNDIIFLKEQVDTKNVSDDQTILFLNVSTEVLKNHYEIEKMALNIRQQKISKYKEAQAWHLLQKPTLEILI